MNVQLTSALAEPSVVKFDNSRGDSFLYNADCMEILSKIPNACVDLVLTDPPYNIGGHMKSRGSGVHRLRENHFSTCLWDNLDESLWVSNMENLAKSLFRVTKDGGSVIVFMSIIKVETLKKAFEQAGFYYKTVGIWHKKNPIPRNMNINFLNSTESWIYFVKKKATGTFNNNGKAIHDFVETGLTPASEKRLGKHPTQKPLALMNFFIELLSNEGDLVLDPFAGSGSSLVSAHTLGRRFCGSEMEVAYFNLAKERILSTQKTKGSDVCN